MRQILLLHIAAVMCREDPVDERRIAVEQLRDGAIGLNQMSCQSDRFFKDRLAQFVVVARKCGSVDGVFLKIIPIPQPLTEELARERADPWILQHASGLREQLIFVLQSVIFGCSQEFIIRQRRPQKQTQPTGQILISQRIDPGPVSHCGKVIAEFRRHQHGRQHSSQRAFHILTFTTKSAVKLHQRFTFLDTQRTTVRAAGECVDVRQCLRFSGR